MEKICAVTCYDATHNGVVGWVASYEEAEKIFRAAGEVLGVEEDPGSKTFFMRLETGRERELLVQEVGQLTPEKMRALFPPVES